MTFHHFKRSKMIFSIAETTNVSINISLVILILLMAKATQIIPQSTNTLGILLYYLGVSLLVTQCNLYLQPAWYGHKYQLSEMSANCFFYFRILYYKLCIISKITSHFHFSIILGKEFYEPHRSSSQNYIKSISVSNAREMDKEHLRGLYSKLNNLPELMNRRFQVGSKPPSVPVDTYSFQVSHIQKPVDTYSF